MGKQMKPLFAVIGGCILAGVTLPLLAAAPADWSKIPVKKVTLFYPGQSTYQWLRSPEHKKGDKKVAKGGACVTCHEDDEAEMGKKVVSGQKLEPVKLGDKPATIDLAVQAAHDGKYLYWRFQWKTAGDTPGTAYPFYRFDGKAWVKYGEPRLNQAVQEGKQPAVYEDRLSIMLDDGKVPHFKQQGCWLTCHDGMRDTKGAASKDQVQANALLGDKLKKSDVRKYLPATRTDDLAAWDKTRSTDEIAKLKAAGAFVELMQWRAHRSNPVGMADDGYVLEYRNFDAGKNMFSANFDKDKNQPKFMFDAGKTGMKAQRAETMRDASKPQALVPGESAVAFDPNAGWKEGDLLSQYYVSRALATDSAADNGEAQGAWDKGVWTVVWKRPLDTGHPQDDKILKVGGYYNVGFAVHDGNITTRGHHVSFPVVLGIGATGGITAVKVP